ALIGFVDQGTADTSADRERAFRKGLSEAGYVEGQNATVEYHWMEGQDDPLSALMADFVRRRVAVIASMGAVPARAAKAATATIPIVFYAGTDPVKLGLVASLARPGGNATGVNSFVGEFETKRIGLVSKAVRVAVLVGPGSTVNEFTLPGVQEAARAIGLQIKVFKANTIAEIEAAFATLESEHIEALLVTGNRFLG